MKKKMQLTYSALIVILMASCISSNYYQIFTVASNNSSIDTVSHLAYEDKNCKVFYNLWSDRGNIGFRFYNKTEKNIYLNLEESFFVINGVAKNYYKNRVYSNSIGAGATKVQEGITPVRLINSAGYSVSYSEEKIICIPSNSSKIISEYDIVQSRFIDCDLIDFPTKSQINSKSFSKDTSPIVFSNRIAYNLEQSDSLIRFENEFYISEITNYPSSEIIDSRYDENCGRPNLYLTKYMKGVSATKFYFKYTRQP